jgi:L-asparaginase
MIKILITGGTIDKNYNCLTGELEFSKSYVPEILKQANITAVIETHTLMLKDSFDITTYDRGIIVKACQATQQDKIIITHGTDTMCETANYLVSNLDKKTLETKTIVLTGAMRPFKLGDSDGIFNLGFATSQVLNSRPGVFINMNGNSFIAGSVTKNTKIGVFQKLK